MTLWKRQNHSDSKKISFPWDCGWGRKNKQSTEDFYSTENMLGGIKMLNTCNYKYNKTKKIYNTKRE